jgi:endoglucanase
MYSIVWDLDYTNVVKPYLDKGYKVVICLEFVDLFPNLKEIGDGLYDAELTVFAKDIRDGLKEVEIRPMHEFNGNWYEWCTYLGGTNTKKNFIRAWAHIVDLFREIGAPVRWQLNYNNNNYADSTDPFSDWYPGDQYVDVVCISGYNRAGVVNSDQVWTSFEDVVKNAYESIVAMTDKPVCIGETSSSDIGGDKAAWILDAFETIATKYTHIIGITWFLYNKVGDGNWDLNTGNEINAFVDGINYVRDNAVVPYGDDYANYFDYNIGTLSPTNAPTYSPTNSPVHFTEDDETGNPAFIA